MILYPVLLNLNGARCTIVGGGNVARRKIEHLLEAGARVRVVAPRLHAEIRRWQREGRVEVDKREYSGDLLDDRPRLVYACTDRRDVNRRVMEDARALGIAANASDDPEGADFHVPSMVRRGSLLVTVSTGGKAPALARELTHRLEQQFGPAWGDFTDLLGTLRAEWKRKGEATRLHARMKEIIGSDTFEVMQTRGTQAALRHARALVRQMEKLNAAETGSNDSRPSREARSTKARSNSGRADADLSAESEGV